MPGRILLVDDDSLNSFALKEHLEAEGYQVACAEGCEEAAALLRSREKFDLMLLDYLMSDGSGTDLLQMIVREAGFQRPPVLIYSSLVEQNDPHWRALLQRLPALSQSLIQGYVNKPFAFETVDQIIKETLQRTLHPNQISSGDYPTVRAIRPRDNAA